MKTIDLYNQNLTKLTEIDLIALCQLNGFKPEELGELDLTDNKLTNLDFITSVTPFINLNKLYIIFNKITDISNLKYLKNLENLDISKFELNNEKDTIELFKTMNKLKYLCCYNTFKTYTYEQLKEVLPNIKEIEK